MITYKMYIAGHWIDSKATIPVTNPFNQKKIGFLPQASLKQINNAVQAAQRGQNIMANLAIHNRADILTKTTAILDQKKEDMINSIILESGKPYKWAKGEVARALENLKFCTSECLKIHGETVPMDASKGSENRIGFWMRSPVGIVLAISPFNFPLNLVVHKVAPAIAAGNSVILKPASATPGPSQLLTEMLLEAGLPAEGINLVFGSGSEVGEALVKDERISKITFTGSPPVGRRIKELSGLKKVTLELGSNSGTVVDKDADIDTTVNKCVIGSFAYSGQVCISVQRIYVQTDIYDLFLKKFVEKTRALKIGNPKNKSTEIGPMINEQEANRVEKWLNQAIENGANIFIGGKRSGNIIEPAVLNNVNENLPIMCQEAFGPVVSIHPFNDFHTALDLLNNSIYGLQAGIFTQDISKAFAAIKKINVGGIMINDVPTFRVDHMPYGGNKESGLGREGAKFAIEEMTNLKMVSFGL